MEVQNPRLVEMSLRELKEFATVAGISKQNLKTRDDYITKLSGLTDVDKLLDDWAKSLAHLLNKMTVKELNDLAAKFNIDVGTAKRKKQLIKILSSHPSKDSIAQELLEEYSLEKIKDELEVVKEDIEETVQKVSLPPMDDPVADSMIKQALSKEVDFDQCEDLIDQARMRYEEFNFEGALSAAVEAKKISEKCRRDLDESVMAYAIVSAQRLLEEVGKAGRDVEKAADILRSAKRFYREGEFANTKDLMADLETASRNLFSVEVQRARDQIHSAQELIRDIANLGADIHEADQALVNARDALKRSEYQACIKYAAQSSKLAELARRERLKNIEEEVPATVAIIEEAKHVGADVSEAERFISKAKTAIASKEYLLASELIKRAERSAMESQQNQILKAMELRRRQVEKAQGMISQVEPVLEEAESFGIDTSEVHTLLQQAKEILNEGDYVNGTIYARNAVDTARKLEPKLVEERTKRGIAKPTEGVCASCGSRNLEFTDDGWSACQDCGYVYRWRAPGGVWWRFKSLWKG